jgi:hypothetical protein
MHHDLIAVARQPAVEVGRQGAFGQPSKRVGAALSDRD